MNLYSLLQKRLETKGPVTVGLIGAGKFGSMFLAQAAKTKGLEVAVIADLSPDRAKAACRATGWDDGLIGRTEFTDDAFAMIASDKVEVVVDATGAPSAGIAHAFAAANNGKHIFIGEY